MAELKESGDDLNDLNKKTKQELINEIVELRKKLNEPNIIRKEKSHRVKHSKACFDEYVYQQVALKISYLGWNYHGFATQVGLSTVEEEIITAIKQLNLIKGTLSEAKYSRCGRTDADVSAVGQVVSCRMRANYKIDNILTDQEKNELDYKLYILGLNNILPIDIRVVSWCRVSDSFSARFDCISRTYKYFIPSKGLDLRLMLDASFFLLGNHDFRNFCRVTMSNPVKHFLRTIHNISIETIDSEFCSLTVIGNAFLHNQIRNIASVLVSVGLGYEDISIVEKLLNVNEYPDKPAYSLLSGLPLILYDCAYANVEWQSPKTQILTPLQISHVELMSKNLVFKAILQSTNNLHENLENMPSRCLMATPCFKRYIPMMDRTSTKERSEKIQKMLSNK